ncbi:alpha/beta hydrolase family protein [Pseudoxanthomonas suwonensis]|uniref:alpha/beta hydrolase family protein n=1 Tax=Pseudoxanthomonas suwonensis TaxID=314722 RepID=UPI000698FD4B|nr:alpha/beta fold hydrolase [Pseudoxanthomonas suwonensis]
MTGKVSRHGSGLAAALVLAVLAASPARAQEACTLPAGTEPFAFESGGNRLRGFVDLPEGAGPHPAVVFVHGAGPTDVSGRDPGFNGSYDRLRAVFRRTGIATVAWTKAGDGCSEGGYAADAVLVDRASETVAAVAALRQRQDIDPERIGLWAISQGGWIAPMAAVRDPRIAFLIVVSGPGREAGADTAYHFSQLLRRQGVGDAEADQAAATLRRALAIAGAGGSREEFLAATAPLERYPLFARMGIGDTAETDWLGPDHLLRADTYLAQLRQPTLAIFGDRDVMVDWRASVDAYRDAFARGGNPALTIRVFEGADHGLFPAIDRPRDREERGRTAYVDGYPELMAGWLQEHGFTGTTGATPSPVHATSRP